MFTLLALTGPDPTALPGGDVMGAIRGLAAVVIVVGLVAVFAWLLRRGAFGPLGRRGPSAIRVETAVPLGERRSLLVVCVEGRRLLLGLTPAQVSLVAELRSAEPGFAGALERAVDVPPRGQQ
ncbi:MAG TPA: flagellar biosynthetic protein FliO [Vicinamibacterales bacterium]|jgi:flagellar biosynthetic protein FliO